MSGTVGSERRMEYAAVGDTTNVAARLQAATKGTPHALFVSETTLGAPRRLRRACASPSSARRRSPGAAGRSRSTRRAPGSAASPSRRAWRPSGRSGGGASARCRPGPRRRPCGRRRCRACRCTNSTPLPSSSSRADADVVDLQAPPGSRAPRTPEPERVGLHEGDRQRARLELVRGHLAPLLGAFEAERVLVEVDRPIHVGGRHDDEVDAGDVHARQPTPRARAARTAPRLRRGGAGAPSASRRTSTRRSRTGMTSRPPGASWSSSAAGTPSRADAATLIASYGRRRRVALGPVADDSSTPSTPAAARFARRAL